MKQFLTKLAIFMLLSVAILGYALFAIPNSKSSESILGSMVDKHKLLSAKRSPKVIFIGGSNLAFGLDCRSIQDQLKIPVYNAAIHASIGLKFQLQDAKRFVKEGDIIIISPEYSQFYTDSFYGKTELISILFDIFPEGRQMIDFQHWLKLMPHIPQYAASKIKYQKAIKKKIAIDVYDRRTFNEYGDATAHWTLPRIKVTPSKPETGQETINSECMKSLKDFETLVKSKSATMYFIPPAYQASSYNNQKSIIKKTHLNLLENKFLVLASPEAYKYPDSLFFDTNYHLTKQGVDLRTKMVINDITAVIHKPVY